MTEVRPRRLGEGVDGARGQESMEVPRIEVPEWSDRLGVVAGITGRGGASLPFDLGLKSAQPVGAVMDRWEAFLGGFPGFTSFHLNFQVHGTRLRRAGPGDGWVLHHGFDGHLTDVPGTLLLVTVADCIPVFLATMDGRAVAVLHAGWRGVAGGILRVAAERMVAEFFCSVDNIVMHCGVGVCGMCYEVGSEVMSACGRTVVGPAPWYLDLRAVLAEQARVIGIGEISTSELCSAHDTTRFFSHRASRGRDGRMVAYIGILP